MCIPRPCPFAASKTLSLVPTNNSPYPEVMLSVVKQKPHFPVSMRKEHLLQRNDIWMLELPQQLQKKKSTTVISIHPELGYLQHKQQKLKSASHSKQLFFMKEPVISVKPKLKVGHNPRKAFTSYSCSKKLKST